MDELRLIAVGNVDDGKSTLLGRLLYDSKVMFRDHLDALLRASTRQGQELNLALITDGLRREREQGITIDVAYRFFATKKRKFVVIDAPGHFQYTRNMVTGASTADVGLILVDATQGVQEQTKRHFYLLSLLRVPHVIVCVNKMDLVDYSLAAFEKVQREFATLAANVKFESLQFIPVSSIHGENVVRKSALMPWFSGTPVLDTLETLNVGDNDGGAFRFAIQGSLAITQKRHASTGMVLRGAARVGDEVFVLPERKRTRIAAIHRFPETPDHCKAGESIALELEGNLNPGRGATAVSAQPDEPRVSANVKATGCWFAKTPLKKGATFLLRVATQEIRCQIDELEDKLNVHTLSRECGTDSLETNDIGTIRLKLSTPVVFDSYSVSKLTGSGILMDEATNATVAALMLEKN